MVNTKLTCVSNQLINKNSIITQLNAFSLQFEFYLHSLLSFYSECVDCWTNILQRLNFQSQLLP